MLRQITHISVKQTSKVFACFYFVIAVVVAICIFIADILGTHEVPLIAIVVFPFIYAAILWAVFAFMAWLYNRIAERVGGIEFDVREIGTASTAAPISGP